MRTAFEREGDVRSVDLLVAFATLWREQGSGVLDFSRPGRTVRFDLADGEIVRASSSDVSFETAEILRRAEKLSPEALADGRIPSGSDRARYLRDVGLLSDRDWRWGEKLRIVEVLSDLVGWLDGTFQYRPETLPEPSDFQIGIHRVVLELYLRSFDRAFIHHSLGAPDAVLERAADFDEKFASLGLTPDALAVASAIDGKASAAEISRQTPPDSFSVEKLLAALATLGLVHPEYAREDPTPAGPAESAPSEPPPPPTEPARATVVDHETPPPVDLEMRPLPSEPPAPRDELELVEISAHPASAEAASEVDLRETAVAEPLDQPLAVVEAPDFGVARRNQRSPIWFLLLLAGAVGALLLLRTRVPSSASKEIVPTSPKRAATEFPLPAAAPALPVLPSATPMTPVPMTPTVLPTIPPTVPPTEAPATPAIEPSPRPTAVVSRPSPVVAAPRTREAWLALAERDRRRLASDSRIRYSIQLELVCELPSLVEAWVYDRQGAMWLVTAPYQGRACFRVFWGRYPTLEEARAAKTSVPEFFFTPTNRPVVVSTGPALLR